MDVTELQIFGVKLLRPQQFEDARGRFSETFNHRSLNNIGIKDEFVQDNDAITCDLNIIRGLHFQAPPSAQAKLVRVVRGRIFDVVVDIRLGSPTFGRQLSVTLTAEKGEQLYVPEGLAHGYCTLDETVHVIYKVNEYYAPEQERGLAWDDPDLCIKWPASANVAVLNARDQSWPRLKDLDPPFTWEYGD